MAQITLVQVGDRLHAIHQTITGVRASRYFPSAPNTAQLPMIVAFPGRNVYAAPGVSAGMNVNNSTRTWTIRLFAGVWTGGLPTDSAQAAAETWMDVIVDAYISRPRLELSGVGLDGVVKTRLVEDSGLIALGEPPMAVIDWQLEIITRGTFLRATERG